MLEYIFLGLVQGITEFLPVSSSGHLAVMQHILGMRGEEVAVAVALHLGTLLSLAVFFFKDLVGLIRKPGLALLLFTTTAITAIIGFSGKDFFESLFRAPLAVAAALAINGIILIFTRGFSGGLREKIGIKDALILGLTQGVAVIPGISRSGITISTLLFRGINRESAFRFSFLAAIPVILGSALLEARHIAAVARAEALNLSAGFLASFLAGIIALAFLRVLLNKSRLYYFGYYSVAAAAAIILLVR